MPLMDLLKIPDHTVISKWKLTIFCIAYVLATEDMNIPGFRLQALKGPERGRWAVWVSGNWRLTFEFQNGDVHILDYEDYH